jgi:iron complex outermembrane receptor protein
MGGDATAPDYTLNNTGVRELNASLTMEVGDERLGLSSVASIFSTSLGIFSGAHIGNATDMLRAIQRGNPSFSRPFSYDITNPRQEISHAMVSVKGHAQLSQDERVVLTVGHQVNDRNEFDGHNVRIRGRGTDPVARAADSIARLERVLATPAMNLVLRTSSLDASLEHALSDRVRGTVGVSSMWQLNERSGSVILIPDYRLWGIGAFAYESIMLQDVTLSVGIRYDVRDLKSRIINRVTGQAPLQYRRWQNFSASVGALWTPVEGLSLTWNAASSWRPPQVNELYSNDVHHGSAYYEIGDSTLASERTLGSDVGLRYESEGLLIETSAFINRIGDYIMAVPDPANPTITVRGTFPTYRFTQMTARLFGGDLSLTVPLHERLNVYGQASFVRGDNLDLNEPLLFIPADRGRLGLHLHADDVGPIHDAYVDVSIAGVRRQDRVVPGRDYAEPPAGYLRTDLSVGGVVTLPYGLQSRLTLACTNLFDAAYREYLSQYRYFADDLGRNIILRFTTSF